MGIGVANTFCRELIQDRGFRIGVAVATHHGGNIFEGDVENIGSISCGGIQSKRPRKKNRALCNTEEGESFDYHNCKRWGDNQPTICQFPSTRFGLFGTAMGMGRKWALYSDVNLVFFFLAFLGLNKKGSSSHQRKVNHPLRTKN